ncbi:OadG family protein [Porticoccus sp.]
MTNPLLQQGLDLMIYGMGTVFFFLALLVAITALMSALISRFLPVVAESQSDTQEKLAGQIDEHLLAILQGAIDQHRRKH